MVDFKIKENDNSPDLTATLRDFNGIVNLTTATGVLFQMERIKTTRNKINAAADIDDAVQGIVSYDWQPGDTDTVGLYRAVFQVTFNNGDIATFPSDGYISIVIQKDITTFV